MSDTNSIYTITAITENGKDSRCWGFYFCYAKALNAVERNIGGLDDCMFDYVVIEEHPEGVLRIATVKQWFKYKKVPDDVEWVEIDPPEWAEGVSNWGIG